jgi:hypothetical protein
LLEEKRKARLDLQEHQRELASNAKHSKRLRKQQEKLERQRQKLLAKEMQLAEQARVVKRWREKDK